MVIAEGMSYADDAAWQPLIEQLREKLVTQNALSRTDAERFEAGIAHHRELDTHAGLVRVKKKLLAQITSLEKRIGNKQRKIARKKKQIAAWSVTRDVLNSEKGQVFVGIVAT